MRGFRQFWALAQFSLAVAVRLRIGWLVAAAAVALVTGGALLRELHFGPAEPGFLVDYVGGVFALGGAVLAALVGPTLFFEGLRSRTTIVLLLHGARRAAVVAAQIGATLVPLGWLAALCAVAGVALLSSLGHGALVGEAVRAVARGAGPLLVVAAAGVFFATLARSALLATALTLALALAGHLAPVIAQGAAHAAGPVRFGWRLLGWLVPNLAVGETVPGLWALGYFAVYALVYAVLAGWVFSRREL